MRQSRRAHLAAVLAVASCLTVAAAEAQPLRVIPTLVDCVEAGRTASIVASFRPVDRLARATLYFRSGGTRAWYSVEMGLHGNRLVGLIPPPMVETAEVEYYFDWVDRDLGVYRSAPFTARVVSGPSECGGRVAGAVSDAPAIVLGVEEGAPGMPAGFLAENLVETRRVDSAAAPAETPEGPAVPAASEPSAAPIASGEDTSALESAETSGEGGGFPVALALLGAGGAAAAAVAVSGADDAGDSSGGGSPGSGPAPTPTPTPPEGDALTGLWEARVTEVGELAGLSCTWTSTVLFEFRVEGEQELTGTAITSSTQSNAAACGSREPAGRAFPIRGRTDGARLRFLVEVPAEVGMPTYDGVLQGNAIEGTMRRDSGTEGSWTGQRR